VNDTGRTDRLRVLALASDDEDAALLYETFATAGDEVLSFVDMNAALAAAEHALPDLALVDVGLQQGAGLTLVHHLRSQATRVDVYALVPPERLETGAQAISLGARAVIVRPLSGDELLNAARVVREARAVERERWSLIAEVESMRRDVAYALRLAALGAVEQGDQVPSEMLALLAEVSGARVAAVYEPRPGGLTFRRKASWGDLAESPAFCDAATLRALGRRPGYSLTPLVLGTREVGHLVLGYPYGSGARGPRLSPLLTAQAALVLSSIAGSTHEAHAFEALPFASFVQVGAQLLGATGAAPWATVAALRPSREGGARGYVDAHEGLLRAVRAEGGVVGQADDGTSFFLFPEANRLAHHARRRRLWGLLAREGVQVACGLGAVGVAGRGPGSRETAVREALRRAAHRAEGSQHSPVRRPELAALPLTELLDALTWPGPEETRKLSSSLQAIDLPSADAAVLAVRALEEATRLGEVSVTVSGNRGSEPGPPLIFGPALSSGRPLALRSASGHAGTDRVEAFVLYAERGAYAFLGRRSGTMFHGVHTADELLIDLLALRLIEPGGESAS
jgi:DNA-binding response OmpR family regulator